MTNIVPQTDIIPDAPEAPVHYDNQEASAWQSGWTSGYEVGYKVFDARIRELTKHSSNHDSAIPIAAEISMDSPHITNGEKWCWKIRDIYNIKTVFAKGESSDGLEAFTQATNSLNATKRALEKTPDGAGVERIERWQDQFQPNTEISENDQQFRAMQNEIDSLRAYAKGLEAGADHLNKVVSELRSKQPVLPKPVAYRYSTSGMWLFTTRRTEAVEERLAYEESHKDDPDLEHEEPEALFSEEQVVSLLAGRT